MADRSPGGGEGCGVVWAAAIAAWGFALLLDSQDSQTGVSQQKGKRPSIIESATVNIILATERDGSGGVGRWSGQMPETGSIWHFLHVQVPLTPTPALHTGRFANQASFEGEVP